VPCKRFIRDEQKIQYTNGSRYVQSQVLICDTSAAMLWESENEKCFRTLNFRNFSIIFALNRNVFDLKQRKSIIIIRKYSNFFYLIMPGKLFFGFFSSFFCR